ncbi:hypothetical protein IWQ56_006499 [Coemansia nantahalensis]|nr:hypothetical protein IWQ56_006499 [Coemansia nantahalensis]
MRVGDSAVAYPVRAVVVMGPSGCGKSSVGSALARALGNAPFIDADSLHSQESRDKMAGGVPLTDGDRWPWLGRVRQRIEAEARALVDAQSARGPADAQPLYIVCACSALKRSYRELLARGDALAAVADVLHDTLFVYLAVDRQELARRLGARQSHFMSPQLLDSQLAALDPPDDTREAAVSVDANGSLGSVVDDAAEWIRRFVAAPV